MHGEPRPSYARRIVLVVLAVCIGLVVLGALLPSPTQRQAAVKARRLASLIKAKRPAISPYPAFVRPVIIEASRASGRAITVHVYLKLGSRKSRSDLLTGSYSSFGGPGSQTVLHIAFDPKKTNELRLATALAAHPGETDLFYDAFLTGYHKVGASARLIHAERTAGSVALDKARRAVLAELADGSAVAYPAGTVLYETEGRFYFEPKPATTSASFSYSGSSTAGYEMLETLSDRNVPLP